MVYVKVDSIGKEPEWLFVIRDVLTAQVETIVLGVANANLTASVKGYTESYIPALSGTQTQCYQVNSEGSKSVDGKGVGYIFVPESPRPLTVRADLDRSKSNLCASISWYHMQYGLQLQVPDKWQIIVRNMTWRLNDKWYHEWIFVLNENSASFQLPLWFRHGNRYHVTVRGLKRRPGPSATVNQVATPSGVTTGDDDNQCYAVTHKGEIEFRTGEVLTMMDMNTLLEKARSYIRMNHVSYVTQRRMMRNKSVGYFDRVHNQHGGVMRAYTKDATGDLRSPINGEFDGLFFMWGLRCGKSSSMSPFGNTRVWIDARTLLDLAPNIYFADFYCMNRVDHYVTLVLTRTGTPADTLCRQRLPRINTYDRSAGQILYDDGGNMNLSDAVFVEVFFADDVNLKQLKETGKAEMQNSVGVFGSGQTTQGGRQKTAGCPTCDVFHGRSFESCPGGLQVF